MADFGKYAVFLMAICIGLTQLGCPRKDAFKAKDVDGWGNVKWGMTAQEAQAASPAPYVTVEGIKLAVSLCTASTYLCDNTGRRESVFPSETIKKVRLAMITFVDSDDADANPQPAMGNWENIYDDLKTALIRRYGQPASEDKDKNEGQAPFVKRITAATWIFPSTTIVLKWDRPLTHPVIGEVSITYQPVDKKAKDVL